MLKGKNILVGITGGIAAYKIAGLCSTLVKMNADVSVMMTENACQFITPLTLETITKNKCMIDTFDRNFQYDVKHISAANKADLLIIAPATANVIGKLSWGIADDFLTTTAMACKCPKLIAPAMNTNMYTNPVVQENLNRLSKFDWEIIEPESGRLACGDIGTGRMASEDVLISYILKSVCCPKDLKGKRVLITAGPTRESIDPVRFITNHSTGKMGYAIANRAMLRGADVTLVTGKTSISPPPFVNTIEIETASEMYEAVMKLHENADIIIMAAAVADYKPIMSAKNKIKKSGNEIKIDLERTSDILESICKKKRKGQVICGFSMETENLLENSKAKLEKKGCDMIAANDLYCQGAGFGTDTNVLTLITKENHTALPKMSKEKAADKILDAALNLTTM